MADSLADLMTDVALDRAAGHSPRWIAGLKRGGARLWVGGALVGVLALVALLAPLIAPHDPLEQDLMSAQLPPAFIAGGDPAYWLGTDSLGRCVLSRLIYAARTAVAVALIAASLAAMIGIAFGLIAGSFGGWVDQVVSRLIDVWMAFPPVLLSIVLAAVIGAGLTSVIAAIVVVDWTRFARVVRAETMVQLQRDYAAAARVIGLSRGAILRLEILPNLIPLLVTLLAVEMGIAILVEVILSFVGISVAGDIPTWGGMIAEGRQIVYQAPWIMALPIGCIISSVIGFNLLGDGLRMALDPVRRR
jgi:ABC-type dipeptide/oligopeptide/nickel transport system permease subunit